MIHESIRQEIDGIREDIRGRYPNVPWHDVHFEPYSEASSQGLAMKPDFSKLSNEQREFITKKVAELGSVEAIESFYSPHPKCKDQSLSTVDLYARRCIPDCWRRGDSPR